MKNIQRKIEAGRERLEKIINGIRGAYRIPEKELKITTTRNGDTYYHRVTFGGRDISSERGLSIVETYKDLNQRELIFNPNLEKSIVVYITPAQRRLKFRK